MAALAAKANETFGPGGPPRDKAKRRALVQSFSEEARKSLEKLDNQFLESPDHTDALDRGLPAQNDESLTPVPGEVSYLGQRQRREGG